jgi:hypothetical protein
MMNSRCMEPPIGKGANLSIGNPEHFKNNVNVDQNKKP